MSALMASISRPPAQIGSQLVGRRVAGDEGAAEALAAEAPNQGGPHSGPRADKQKMMWIDRQVVPAGGG